MKLTAYCMDWHLKASDSSLKIFVEPLAPELEIEQRAWDGTTVPDPLPADRPTVFYMLPPPADFTGDAVWVPMWDQARGFDQAWWDAVPDQVRVVALSDEVERRARAAGLTTLRLQYFLDPATVAPVASGEPPVVFYWNRTGLLGPRALGRVCHDVGARELIFRPTLDPGVPAAMGYELGERLGGVPVTHVTPTTREEYLRDSERGTVYIAPRVSEGVGLTFLEAMARGACVIAFDAPTMSEYVRSGENGVLLRSGPRRPVLSRPYGPQALLPDASWRALRDVDIGALGAEAREDHVAGHRRWLADLPRYRAFVRGAA